MTVGSGLRREDKDAGRQGLPMFLPDLNCLPEETASGIADGKNGKKKRADSKDIARLALEDISKNFEFPIREASIRLKVSQTVLKRKCRELGIPRWPHRKIKSLDGLIRNLQVAAGCQQDKDKAVEEAVVKRQKMLQTEKENIEKKPSMDIEIETKRFRQYFFKRRHSARAMGLAAKN